MLSQSGRVINYTIVPTMFDKRTNASATTLQVLENTYPDRLWGKVIPIDTKFRESSRLGIPPSFLFGETHGVIAYEALTATLLGEDQLVEPA